MLSKQIFEENKIIASIQGKIADDEAHQEFYKNILKIFIDLEFLEDTYIEYHSSQRREKII